MGALSLCSRHKAILKYGLTCTGLQAQSAIRKADDCVESAPKYRISVAFMRSICRGGKPLARVLLPTAGKLPKSIHHERTGASCSLSARCKEWLLPRFKV